MTKVISDRHPAPEAVLKKRGSLSGLFSIRLGLGVKFVDAESDSACVSGCDVPVTFSHLVQ